MTAPVAGLEDPAAASMAGGPDRITFASELVLTKSEAFEGCDALAHAGRLLRAAGRTDAAARLGALFNLLESRLAGA